MTDELYRIVSSLVAARPRKGYAGPRELDLHERELIEAARETGALDDYFGVYAERIEAAFAEYQAGIYTPPDLHRMVGAIVIEMLADETKARLFPDVTCAAIDEDIAEQINEDEKAALRARGRIVDKRNRVAIQSDSGSTTQEGSKQQTN